MWQCNKWLFIKRSSNSFSFWGLNKIFKTRNPLQFYPHFLYSAISDARYGHVEQYFIHTNSQSATIHNMNSLRSRLWNGRRLLMSWWNKEAGVISLLHRKVSFRANKWQNSSFNDFSPQRVTEMKAEQSVPEIQIGGLQHQKQGKCHYMQYYNIFQQCPEML